MRTTRSAGASERASVPVRCYSMSQFVDLHCHSTASDGSLRPREVVRLAQRAGLSGLSLTDHDTIDGLAEAAEECARLGIAFVPGVEISCRWPFPGTLHILGYCFDPQSAAITRLCRRLVEARRQRNPRMVSRLRELGVDITMEELAAEAGGQIVGRPHMAAILVRKGYAGSIPHAFEKYLGPGRPAYFPKETVEPREGIGAITEGGGVAVLAHPTQLKTKSTGDLERILRDLMEMGLQGIEVMHCDHSRRDAEIMNGLARRLGLLRTGGSDFHGNNKEGSALGWAGDLRVPRAFMEELLTRRARAT